MHHIGEAENPILLRCQNFPHWSIAQHNSNQIPRGFLKIEKDKLVLNLYLYYNLYGNAKMQMILNSQNTLAKEEQSWKTHALCLQD